MKSSLIYRPKKFGKKPSAIKVLFQIEEALELLNGLSEWELDGVEADLYRHVQRQCEIFHEKTKTVEFHEPAIKGVVKKHSGARTIREQLEKLFPREDREYDGGRPMPWSE